MKIPTISRDSGSAERRHARVAPNTTSVSPEWAERTSAHASCTQVLTVMPSALERWRSASVVSRERDSSRSPRTCSPSTGADAADAADVADVAPCGSGVGEESPAIAARQTIAARSRLEASSASTHAM